MLTPKQIMDQIISVFENSTTELDYAYCNNEHDGRGFTCGRAGFTTSDGDALQVTRQWPTLYKFNETLQHLCDRNSGDTTALVLGGFEGLWKQAANDPAFRAIQDTVSDNEYYLPAVVLAKRKQVLSDLGSLIFYDTCVQHGFDGPDSLSEIANGLVRNTENEYLELFLAKRRKVLLNPKDKSTAKEWAESVGRVDVLSQLIHENNFSLTTPITINPWNDEKPFIIGGV